MSIKGTGIDIIEISRIDRIIKSSSKFLEKVFTLCEIQYFNSRGNNPCHAAGTFAAKEAVLKALGTGLRGFTWKDVEITRDSLGKPSVVLYGGAKAAALGIGASIVHISISHCRDYAVAYAAAEEV